MQLKVRQSNMLLLSSVQTRSTGESQNVGDHHGLSVANVKHSIRTITVRGEIIINPSNHNFNQGKVCFFAAITRPVANGVGIIIIIIIAFY
jgi:hypothetical protein